MKKTFLCVSSRVKKGNFMSEWSTGKKNIIPCPSGLPQPSTVFQNHPILTSVSANMVPCLTAPDLTGVIYSLTLNTT